MFNTGSGQQWSGIMLCPPAICPIAEARRLLTNPHVYLTDAFVPAKEINQKSDVVICHGGQGTLQTAIMSGVPLVGYPSQPEQKINLQHLQDFGAGVMVSSFNWKAATLQKKVALMIEHQHYKDKAQELKNYAEHLDTKGKIAATVWNMIQKLK
jgi:UDP:flavonoid glycosyltransferase YjiC (YdhE family)